MFKKILKVHTTGSRKEGNLRPAITDDLSEGINLVVLEYDQLDKTCVVEIFGFNHPILPENKRVSQQNLDSLSKHHSVIKELETHAKLKVHDIEMSIVKFDKINAKQPANKKFTFKRKVTRNKHGQQVECVILDEG